MAQFGQGSMKYLMLDVYWSFWGPEYATYQDFVEAVTRYNDEIAPEGHGWEPDRVISKKPIRVVYEPLWTGQEHDVDLTVGEPGQPVTMGRLLFTIQRATHDLFADADHHYFEGLERVRWRRRTYRILTGS